MRVIFIILLMSLVRICTYGQDNQPVESSIIKDSVANTNRGNETSVKGLIAKITNLENEKIGKNDLTSIERSIVNINEKLDTMYNIFAISILLALIGVSLLIISIFNKKIKNLKKDIIDLKSELKKEKDSLTEVGSVRNYKNFSEVKNIEDNSIKNLLDINKDLAIVATNPISSNSYKIYFGGPEGLVFLSEFQHSKIVADKSLFEFVVDELSSSSATFSILENPYTLKTIINNRVIFEAVCDFSEFNYSAQSIESQKEGKAKKTDKGWEVTQKTVVRLV